MSPGVSLVSQGCLQGCPSVLRCPYRHSGAPVCPVGVLVSQGEFLMPLQFPWLQVMCFQGGPVCPSVVAGVVLVSPGRSTCPSGVSVGPCVSQCVPGGGH